jgi:hypothetical protein
MNLKDYIKSIEEFLLNEDFAEGTSDDMRNKVKELEAIKAEFLKFLEAIKAKNIDLKTIQAKAKAEGGGPEGTAGEKTPEAPQTAGAPQDGEQPQGGTPPQGKTTEGETSEDGKPEAKPSDPAPESE